MPQKKRQLAAIMFTDIVGSTDLASKLGDVQWQDLLGSHHAAIRYELDVYRGREIKTTGDGFHATFDGPARAIRCALSIHDAIEALGLSVRIGLHQSIEIHPTALLVLTLRSVRFQTRKK